MDLAKFFIPDKSSTLYLKKSKSNQKRHLKEDAKMKKVFCLILAIAMLFSFNSFAFAEVPGSDRTDAPEGTRSISGYASKFVSTSGEGSFNVTVTGVPGLSAGLTFKTSCDESDYAYAVVSIQRPNGSYILHDDAFEANEELPITFFFPTAGTYKISYSVYVPSGATLQMQCWIYG